MTLIFLMNNKMNERKNSTHQYVKKPIESIERVKLKSIEIADGLSLCKSSGYT